MVKPLYPWVGGKTRVLNLININTPERFGNYHEPFLGGGAVALGMMEQYEDKTFYLSDFNAELVAAWQAVKDTPVEVEELLREHYARHERSYFMSVRSWDRSGILTHLTTAERGARFIYICTTAFRGMWSENDEGYCSSSFGFTTTPNYNFDNLHKVSQLLNTRNTVITHQSYEQGLTHVTTADLVYLDPPYATDDDEGVATFDAYVNGGIDNNFQKRVKRYLGSLTARGAFVLTSNANTSTTRELFDGWNTSKKPIIYSLSIKNNGQKDEMVFANHHLRLALA